MSRESNRAWNKAHPERCRAACERYKKRNPELILSRAREYYHRNRDASRKRALDYYYRNRNKQRANNLAWKKLHPENLRVHQRRQRMKPNVKLRHNLATRLLTSLKQQWKSGRTIELLGCSIPDFRIYLESLFEAGMSWDNYGPNGWHIDHIMPCAIFDLTRADHQRRCFHFSNMQPMWAADNLAKGKKIAC